MENKTIKSELVSITDNKQYLTLWYHIIPKMLVFIWQIFLVQINYKSNKA